MSDNFISFDDARKRVVEALKGAEIPVDRLYLVRNMFGRVRISAPERFEEDKACRKASEALALRVGEAAGPHGHPPDRTGVLFVPDDLLRTLDNRVEAVAEVDGAYWAERPVTGRGWWTVGDPSRKGNAKRWTLFSVKGGVGRGATAAVLARHLARGGERVLVVDPDLESPALSSAMLEPRARPDFGVADWFVEDLVGQGDRVIESMTAAPAWADDVDGAAAAAVAPAHGRDSGEYLAKLGRVHMENAKEPWAARLERLLTALEARLEPTVVLLDSRFGLHDIAAAAVTDVAADVLLFADGSEAGWTDYGLLFRHWRECRLATSMRQRLSFVSALTPPKNTAAYLGRFSKRTRRLFRKRLSEAPDSPTESNGGFSSNAQEGDDSRDPMPIFWHEDLAAGASLRDPGETTVETAYRGFFDRFASPVGAPERGPRAPAGAGRASENA